MSQRKRVLGTILAVTALVAACNSRSTATSQAASEASAASHAALSAAPSAAATPGTPPVTEQVTLSGSSFSVAQLTVATGTTVVFTNQGSFDHTITEGTNGTPVDDPIVNRAISPQGRVSVTFDEPGEYHITCTIHPSMNMTVIVEG